MQKIRNRKIIYIIAFMMISLCRTAFLGAQLPTNGLIAYYPFNGNAVDESGNGNNPVSQNYHIASDRCGFASSAYKSENTTSIYLPPANFVGLNEYSYSLWFRADSISSVDNWILFSVGSPVEGYEQVLSLYSGGTLIGTGSNVGNNPALTTVSSDPVQASRWIHIVLTRDNIRMRMFLNGAQISISGPNSLTNSLPANYGPDPKVTIGCQFGESMYNFMGAIDEVRIYDRVLTEQEIEQLYYTECTLSELAGPTEVCQGQKNVTYFVDPLDNASDYEWSYSGTGLTINGNGNQITIDLADNATSGTLSVTVTGDFIDTQTRSIAIQVQKLPSDAGIINGEAIVCQGDTGIIYQVPEIDNATSYNWRYGETIFTSNSNSISMDFPVNATSGNLIVTGHNVCGDGPESSPLAITVSQLPYNPAVITGESSVCQGQQGVSYTIPAIPNALDYGWNYSGTGFTITQDSNTVTLDFDSTATSGDLTVWGINNCGNSATPAVFPISVLSIPGNAGNLSGENAVCLNQIKVLYSVTTIEFATSYFWEYSGTGAALTVKTNTVVMDFSDQATSGNLTVTGRNNCGDGARSPEFLITVSDCSMEPVEITIPNSFTPNGDGVNDLFLIQGLPENSTLIIFDRAGHKLFESFSYANDWDGKDRGGKLLNSGTYWYVLSVSGQPEEYKGFVYLKR